MAFIRRYHYSRSIFRLSKFNHGNPTLLVTYLLLLLLVFVQQAIAQVGSVPAPPDDFTFGPTINKNMAIVLVVLVCVFFILGFLSVYTRQCSQNRFLTDLDLSAIQGRSNSRSRARGLDATVISTFPTFVYSAVKGIKIGKGLLECAVCLNEFEDHDELRLLPKCNHVFHSDCIDAWLASHSTCPVCRANLIPKPGDITLGNLITMDPHGGPDEPNRGSEYQMQDTHVSIGVGGDNQVRDSQALDASLINPSQMTGENVPARSRSTGWALTGMFPRSHSTGHSPFQPGESYERFTLRLPEEVRSQLMNSTLSRARSCVALPRVQSSRQGYRSGSGRRKNLLSAERSVGTSKSDRWTFALPTPLFGRTGSSRTQKPKVGTGGNGDEDVSERSFVRLMPDSSSQV